MAPQRVVEKIKARIEVSDEGCWIWPGAKAGGYGRTSWKDGDRWVWRAVHRVVYEAEVGAIPEGLDLDHTCHDPATCSPTRASDCPHRACCNPAHLEPVSRQTNLLRGGGVAAQRASATECPEGHPYDEVNTYTDRRGRRSCRTCTRLRNRAYYWKNRERRAVTNKAWREARKG